LRWFRKLRGLREFRGFIRLRFHKSPEGDTRIAMGA